MGMNLDELERLCGKAVGADWRNLPSNMLTEIWDAFPALLALARDGERYREAAKGVWVLTREVNAYDQEGEYFVAVFTSKPTAKQLSKYGVPAYRIESVLCNKGRIDNDDAWHFLRFEQDAAMLAAAPAAPTQRADGLAAKDCGRDYYHCDAPDNCAFPSCGCQPTLSGNRIIDAGTPPAAPTNGEGA